MISRKLILHLFLATFCTFANGYTAETKASYKILTNQAKYPLLNPDLKERKTLKIRLNNGLEAYLISLPKTKMSGGMLSTKVGSWEDPENHEGLAHFVEHMLFMGTQKYPNEGEYQKFISHHGGMTNAFTSSNTTNYIFTVNNGGFEEALDRFSSFFKEPLFNFSSLSRERQAIDQEYAKNLINDDMRQLFVLKEMSNSQHPFSAFNMGNQQSLSNTDQNHLREWFQKHYSANLMKLVVVSPLPVDQLSEIVTRDFSAVPNIHKQSLIVNTPALKSELEGQYIYIEPIQDKRRLTLAWELPSKFSNMKTTRPGDVVSYVLGYEGGKSLLAQLKREKLAEGLSSGESKIGDNLTLFTITIDLTTEGLHDIDHVIGCCFQAIHRLKEKGVPQYLFDEMQQMQIVNYQYQAKEDLFETLMQDAFQIQEEDLATYPEQTTIIQKFQPSDIQELVSYLSPQNAYYLIMAPFKLTGVPPNLNEKWLHVKYATKPISKNLLDQWSHTSPHTEMDLPTPNPFIPSDLKLIHKAENQVKSLVPNPTKLIDNEKISLYFAPDTRFQTPQVSWSFNITTPALTMNDAENLTMNEIYVKNIRDLLDSISYPAKMAGLGYLFYTPYPGQNGVQMQIHIDGYSQNALKVLKEVLTTVKNYQPILADFQTIKDSLIRNYQNFYFDNPLQQAMEVNNSLIYQDYVTKKEKAVALRGVTFKKYSDYTKTLFDQTYIESMLYGNMTEDEAKLVIAEINKTFDGAPYPKAKWPKQKVATLSQSQGPSFLECHTKSPANAVLLTIENPNFSHKERAAQQILMQAIKEPFFSSLRTTQQTGYLVASFGDEIERKLFDIFAVQSNTHDTRDLLARFEQFLEGYIQEMGKTELLSSEFEAIRRSILNEYREPAENVYKMGLLLQTLAYEYDGDFRWIDKRVEAIKALTYEEFLSSAKQFIGRANKRRLAILMNGNIPKENKFSYIRAKTGNAIRKMSAYDVINSPPNE